MTKTREPKIHPPGDRKTLWRTTLETGSRMLQDTSPLKDFDIYVVGFHCAKHAPEMQMEAHHYCRQVNEDFSQCALWDSSGPREPGQIFYVTSTTTFRWDASTPSPIEIDTSSSHPRSPAIA